MSDANVTGDRPIEPQLARSADLDFQAWNHYASAGGEDKNRAVTLATWLLSFSAAILGYALTQSIGPDELILKEPIRTVALSVLGIGLSAASGYLSLLYGGYANRNWEAADEIARRRAWNDLLPPGEGTLGHGLNRLATSLARPCEPEKRLAPVFVVFYAVSIASLVLHVGLAVWSLILL